MSEPVAKRRPMIDLDEFERRLRQPGSASKMPEDDPLAELARLVGSQDDPYKSIFGAEKADARPSEPVKEPDAAPRSFRSTLAADGDFLTSRPPLGTAARQDRYELDHAPEPSGVAEHWSDQDSGDPSFSSDGEIDEPRPRRSIYLMAAIIIVGMAGIGASFVLKGARTGTQEVVTIKAPDGPAKVAVEATAGAAATPDATVLERGPSPQRVGLVDTREQPVDLSQVQERPPRGVGHDTAKPEAGKVVAGAAHVPVPVPPPTGQPSRAQASQDSATSITSLIEPRKVKTVSVRPDGTVVANVPQQPQATDVPLPAPRPATPAKAATPKIAERAPTTPKAVTAPSAEQAQQVAAMPPATKPTAAKGSYAVQLAAPESEQEARELQVKLMKKLGNELSGFHTSIRKAAVGDKTVYRVRVGDLSQEEAIALCQKVKSGGSSCFVAKN